MSEQSGFGAFNFPKTPRKSGGQVAGNAFGVYTTLKMGVLGYQAAQRSLARGQSMEEAVKNGAVTAGAWMGFLCLSLWYPFMAGSLLISPLFFYNPILQQANIGMQANSAAYFWSCYFLLAIPALILQLVVWLVLYSKLVDKIDSKRGRFYRAGFRLRRRFFLLTDWWKLVLLAIFVVTPFSFLVSL